jgi:hypothetical protein
MVRAMDMVSPDAGTEVVVRTLLRAMEHPHNPGTPARPKKIVVRDRELLFYLRGALQELDITLDYVSELPLIDEIFRGLQDAVQARPPQLPEEFSEQLADKAVAICKDAPWEVLADHQILSFEVNQWDVDILYASIMGMLGMEYGILFYRSLDSLQRFRQQAMMESSLEQMQAAFLSQDCLFMTFEPPDEETPPRFPGISPASPEDMTPVFGNLHPMEGMRSFLYEDEAKVMLVCLEAMHRFLQQHRQKFSNDSFPAISGRYKLSNPANATSQITIKVATMPDLAEDLVGLDEEETDTFRFPIVEDDWVPDNSFISLGMLPWSLVKTLRPLAKHYQAQDLTEAGDGLPVVMIQTSQPKAKTLIQAIQTSGGLKGICFNPGQNPFTGDRFEIGILQGMDSTLHLFGEFSEEDTVHASARKKWDQRCKKMKGICGLIVAKGLTGASRGNPQLKDMVGLFETHSLTVQELGLGTLQIHAPEDWIL